MCMDVRFPDLKSVTRVGLKVGIGLWAGWSGARLVAQTVGGGIRIPELNEQGIRTSMLTGARARMFPGKPVQIEGLVIEFFEADGETVRMRLESPGCEYDDRRGKAVSDEQVHITGEGFDIRGKGYEYVARDSRMEIQSEVKVRLRNLTARAKASTDPLPSPEKPATP